MSNAPSANRPSTPTRLLTKGVLYVLAGLVALFVMINVHEIGHTVLARLLGDSRATYALYRLHPDGRLACIGCNVYHEEALSWAGNVAVALGGVLFTQGWAWGLLRYAQQGKGHRCGFFCKILIGVCGFDALFQGLQGLLADIGRQTGLMRVDMADFLWLLSEGTGLPDATLKVGFGLALLLYLGWFASTFRKVRQLRRGM